VAVATANDLEVPRAGPGDGGLHLAALIARIADDALQKGKTSPRLPQQSLCAIPVLHAGRMDADRQQQSERVRQDVALSAQYLLASVPRVQPPAGPRTGSAGRVERGPPLTAPLALWLSMIAVVGLASRPAFSRTST
jgi:hypothetical protein